MPTHSHGRPGRHTIKSTSTLDSCAHCPRTDRRVGPGTSRLHQLRGWTSFANWAFDRRGAHCVRKANAPPTQIRTDQNSQSEEKLPKNCLQAQRYMPAEAEQAAIAGSLIRVDHDNCGEFVYASTEDLPDVRSPPASTPDPGGSNSGSGANLQHAPPFRSPARAHPPMQGVRALPDPPVCARRRMRRSARMRGSRRQRRPFAPPRRWRPVSRGGDRIVRL